MSDAPIEAGTLGALEEAEAACTRCPLYREATQVIPGEGHRQARMMIVGEQPGDREDLAGRWWLGQELKLVAPSVVVAHGNQLHWSPCRSGFLFCRR